MYYVHGANTVHKTVGRRSETATPDLSHTQIAQFSKGILEPYLETLWEIQLIKYKNA